MKVVCFDLDDTLYKEIDYLRSAYRDIARELWGDDWERWYEQMLQWYEAGENVFDNICKLYPEMEKEGLLQMYRFNGHALCLSDEVRECLCALRAKGVKLGLITDGRVVTQENKILSLGLDTFFEEEDIIISEEFGSEKPSEANYKYFMDRYPAASYAYVADNPQKDFVGANALGWNTICLLDDGRNIHKQDFESVAPGGLPNFSIVTFSELGVIV